MIGINDFRTGMKVGEYELIKRVAVGGMAEVFLGEKIGAGGFRKKVILKRLLPQYLKNEKFVKMFYKEAQLISLLNHTNIVQVFDVIKTDYDVYIVMEYVDGPNLIYVVRQFRKQGLPPDIGFFVKIISQIARALDYAYFFEVEGKGALKIVHRDISPGNILISRDGIPKLVDFGIAKSAYLDYISLGEGLKGKLPYMSPEQIRGESVSHQSDIFSLGVVLYELVTFKRLFKRKDELKTVKAVLKGRIKKPSSFIKNFPVELEEIIMKCLERDREKRYKRGKELARDLEKFLKRNYDFEIDQEKIAFVINDLFIQEGKVGVSEEAMIEYQLNSEEYGEEPSIGTEISDDSSSDHTSTEDIKYLERLKSKKGQKNLNIFIFVLTFLFIAVLGFLGVIYLKLTEKQSLNTQIPKIKKGLNVEKDRIKKAQKYLKAIEKLIKEGDFDEANILYDKLDRLKIDDPELDVKKYRLKKEIRFNLALKKLKLMKSRGELDKGIEKINKLLKDFESKEKQEILLNLLSEFQTEKEKQKQQVLNRSKDTKESKETAVKSTLNLKINVPSVVYIDDKKIGVFKMKTLEVEDGVHVIKIEKKGFKPFRKKIVFKEGSARTLTVTLKKLKGSTQKQSIKKEKKKKSYSSKIKKSTKEVKLSSISNKTALPGDSNVKTEEKEEKIEKKSSETAQTPSLSKEKSVKKTYKVPKLGMSASLIRQFAILIKVLAKEEKKFKSKSKINIAIVYVNNPYSIKIAKKVYNQASKLKNQVIDGKSINPVLIEYKNEDQLKQEFLKHRISVVYFPPLSSKEFFKILKVTRKVGAMSTSGVVAYYKGGLTIGVGKEDGAYRIYINLKSAKIEGVKFPEEIIELAKIVE